MPSKIETINAIRDDMMEQEGLSRAEKTDMANQFFQKALYDVTYFELYREIYKFYDEKLFKNYDSLRSIETQQSVLEKKIDKFQT